MLNYEVKNNEKYCPYCGIKIQDEVLTDRSSDSEEGLQKRTGKSLKKWIGLGIIVLTILAIYVVVNNSNQPEHQEAIEKLVAFTRLEQDDEYEDLYRFQYDESWYISYSENNEALRFSDTRVTDCFAYEFGTYDLENDGSFAYDFSENVVRVYFDLDIPEGNLTIVSYSFDENEWSLMIDMDRYYASDEFVNDMESIGIIDIFNEDIAQFYLDLQEHGLTYEEVKEIRSKDVAHYYKKMR